MKLNKFEGFLAGKLAKPLRQFFIWDRRIKILSHHIARLFPKKQVLIGLDVGCGNGELAKNITQLCLDINILGADILISKDAVIDIVKITGNKLPFKDKSFDFTMLIDVLHHTIDPLLIMKECVRVSQKFIIVKDHLCQSRWDRLRLCFMDWVGNQSCGINLTYNYLSSEDWEKLYRESQVKHETFIDRLNLYPWIVSFIFDSKLHFMVKLTIPEGIKDEFNSKANR